MTLTALRSTSGELVGFTKVTRDFSARRAVEAALRQERQVAAQSREMLEEAKRIKRVVATLSHELRTPLTTILGSAALLSPATLANEHDRAHIERLQRSSRHLMSIVDDVLQMARAEAAEPTLVTSVQRLGAAIEDALADVEMHAEQRGVVLVNSVSASADDLPYWGDRGRVRQIVVNLLTNAIKFTEPGGRVTLSGGTALSVAGAVLAGPGPWIYARVEDTGRGIPPDRVPVIFEPFEQSEREHQKRGTGLGLAISRQFARLMGGDITAESEPGVGSRFTLWLPIAPSEPVPL